MHQLWRESSALEDSLTNWSQPASVRRPVRLPMYIMMHNEIPIEVRGTYCMHSSYMVSSLMVKYRCHQLLTNVSTSEKWSSQGNSEWICRIHRGSRYDRRELVSCLSETFLSKISLCLSLLWVYSNSRLLHRLPLWIQQIHSLLPWEDHFSGVLILVSNWWHRYFTIRDDTIYEVCIQ